MLKILSTILFTIFSSLTFSQNNMRPIEELINTKEPGWPLVKGWIDSAKNMVEILPCDTAAAKSALYQTQVTTRSPMGAIIYATGGLLVDGGWIRILGSGSPKLNRTLPEWNKGKTFANFGDKPAYFLVADDAIGGFFAINGGGLGKDAGKIYYLAPDDLVWEPLDLTYSDFLHFCFNNTLDDFYKGLRWKNWKAEVDTLDGNRTYNFFPPLFTKEGRDFNKSSRKAVPVEEQYGLNMVMRKQLGLDKKSN